MTHQDNGPAHSPLPPRADNVPARGDHRRGGDGHLEEDPDQIEAGQGGRLTDAATGAALAGVNASAAGYFTTTNATGYYLLPAVQGNYTITFSLAGYQSVSQPVSVRLDHTATVNAQLGKVPQGLAASVWVLIAVVIIAAVAIAAFAVVSRRRAAPPAK